MDGQIVYRKLTFSNLWHVWRMFYMCIYYYIYMCVCGETRWDIHVGVGNSGKAGALPDISHFEGWLWDERRIWEVDWGLSRKQNEIPCGYCGSLCFPHRAKKTWSLGSDQWGGKNLTVRQKTPTESLGVEGCGKTEEHGMQWWFQMADKQLYNLYMLIIYFICLMWYHLFINVYYNILRSRLMI